MLLPTYVKLPIVILEFYTETCNVTAVSRSNVQLVEGGEKKIASSGNGELFSSKHRHVTKLTKSPIGKSYRRQQLKSPADNIMKRKRKRIRRM